MDSWSFIMSRVSEKYKNNFIMLWKKVHYEEVEEFNRRLDELNKRQKISEEDGKDFYKQCYKTLAKSVHPDEGGDIEAMQCLNQLKVMWGI